MGASAEKSGKMATRKKALILTAIHSLYQLPTYSMFEKLFKFDAPAEIPTSEEQKEQQLASELQQVADLNDAMELGKLAANSPFTRVRQAAADIITDGPVLHELEKHSQDKAVQHIVREKLKAQKLQQQEQQAAQQSIESLCEKLEQLAKSSHSPLFKPQYQHLIHEWEAHQTAPHEVAKRTVMARFNNARSVCESILVQFAAEEKKLEEARQAEAALAAEQIANKAVWAQLAEDQQADQEQALVAKQAEEEKRKQHEKEQSLLERSLLEQIAAIETTLQQGTLANISKKLKSVQQKLDTLEKSRAQQHEGKVHLLVGRLNELRDWQSYAAMPKKQELCEKMQRLIGIDLPTKELSDAIHELQTQWQTLKGGGKEEEQKLWLEFKEAADKAYEPCKQFFGQQREVRTENLRQREKICSELELFASSYDWASHSNDSASWKAVDKIIETAKQEFHRFSPVDHKFQKAIKERYDTALKPIIEKVRDVQKKHEDEKKSLIDNAQKLLELPDVQTAIEQAKTLQQQWKTIGITRPREDQKLWQQFRTACDGVFARRNAQREQAHETLKQDLVKAEEICKQIEDLANLNDNELQKSRDQYQSLRQAFQSINNLHKDKQKRLFSRFYQACDRYQDQVGSIKKRQQQSSLQEAFRKAALCEQLETGASVEAIEAQWKSNLILGSDIENILNKRYANAQKISRGESSINLAENEKQRRTLLIRLEILLDKNSPEEDKSLRMSYQLSQLSNKGLSGKSVVTDKKAQTDALVLEWLGYGSAAGDVQAALQKRFEQLVK